MVGGADLESVGAEEINNEETKPLIQTVKKKQENVRTLSLLVLCFSSFMGGCSISILSPFYSKEAEDHGLSVTASGTVFASVFVLQIVFAPIFGKFIKDIGTVRLFVVGVFIIGFTNILFGLLELIQSGPGFLAASLVLRSVMAIGEAGMYTAVYPLARSISKEGSESSIIGWIEMMLGVGCTIGPFIGGLLFKYGGFFLPFLVCGSLILVAGLFANLILSCGEVKPDISIASNTTTTYWSLIKKPGMLTVCLSTVSTGVSTQWYQASLEPYVRKMFGMSPFQASLLFIIDGGVYALISPIVGILLDRGFNHRFSLGVGLATIGVGYFVLASPFISASLLQICLGLGIHGVGMGVIYLTTFTMMSSIAGEGGQDDEKVQGLVTAIWFLCDSIGGFLGASVGGVAFDSLGWSSSSLVASSLQAFCFLQVIICCCYSTIKIKMRPGRTKLLSEQNKNYGTINNNMI